MFSALVIAYIFLNRTNGAITSSGKTRRYLLHVPASYDASNPVALVISIHGFSDWPANHAHMSQWSKLADKEGFIVVYPSGQKYPKRWQATLAPGSSFEQNPDLVFIRDLIETLQQQYNIDATRIYVNGFSNGGGMSLLIGCEMADVVAAVGSVAGALVQPLDRCDPARPVPMILFHGTADEIVPYYGGPAGRYHTMFPNIPNWARDMAVLNGCNPVAEELPSSVEVSGVRYSSCEQGADVVFYTVHGGGHTWPGGNPLPTFIAGITSNAISATEVMWNFYLEHPLETQ
jgi:polyhydroxybutyrate depolymerase